MTHGGKKKKLKCDKVTYFFAAAATQYAVSVTQCQSLGASSQMGNGQNILVRMLMSQVFTAWAANTICSVAGPYVGAAWIEEKGKSQE